MAETKTKKKPATKKPRAAKKVEAPVTSGEMKIFDQGGKELRSVALPEKVFKMKWNPRLVLQAVLAERANARAATAHTKTRGDVRGGGKKPWQQKGTGRARHGSIRSPLWRGGGVAHGPRSEKNYSVKINKGMRRTALRMVLSRKFRDGELVFVNGLTFDTPKTKEAKVILGNIAKGAQLPELATRRNNAALIALSQNNQNVKKSFRNFSNIDVDEARNLTAARVLGKKFLVVEDPEKAFEYWTK